jgi:hypothetical protein
VRLNPSLTTSLIKGNTSHTEVAATVEVSSSTTTSLEIQLSHLKFSQTMTLATTLQLYKILPKEAILAETKKAIKLIVVVDIAEAVVAEVVAETTIGSETSTKEVITVARTNTSLMRMLAIIVEVVIARIKTEISNNKSLKNNTFPKMKRNNPIMRMTKSL